MKIQTFSIVVGTQACDAECPFCVSKMTGFDELPKSRAINSRNLNKAMLLAENARVTTVLITGKGEPTLYPDEISEYLAHIALRGKFPFIELQTNGLEIGRLARYGRAKVLNEETLKAWYKMGLNTVAISVVDIEAWANKEAYSEDYPDLSTTIHFLHSFGFSVRLCVSMASGWVDCRSRVYDVIRYCRDHGVEQLKITPVRQPKQSDDREVDAWVTERGLKPSQILGIKDWLDHCATPVLSLMHGSTVYDYEGQNICFSDCLTLDGTKEDIRTLIFYSDGRIAFDWQYDGALLLGGRRAREDQDLTRPCAWCGSRKATLRAWSGPDESEYLCKPCADARRAKEGAI